MLLGVGGSQLSPAIPDPCSIAVGEMPKGLVLSTQSEDDVHKHQEDSVDKLVSSFMPTKNNTAAGGDELAEGDALTVTAEETKLISNPNEFIGW